MTHGLSDQLLSQLSRFVARRLGLHFPQERWRDLERGLRSAAHELGAPNADTYAQELLSGPLTRQQLEILASNLTIGETYFFREKRSFAILSEAILPDLIRARQETGRSLRIWSAGCCTGEEPYSLAILLDRILPDPRRWRVTVLGTDVNPRFLQKAAEGVFGEWSFRDAPPWLKERYFEPVGARQFVILPRIKEMVTFASLNLAEDRYPSLAAGTERMDLIFCRNVLMYFAPDQARRVMHKFYRSLTDDGWLNVSATETFTQLPSLFTPSRFEGATFYRKANPPSAAWTTLSLKGRTAGARSEEAQGSPPLSQPPPEFAPAPSPSILPTQTLVKLPTRVQEQTQPLNPPPSVYAEALALFAQGNSLAAVWKLKAEAERPGETAERSALLARACANLGELSEAREWAEKAIAADKLSAELHYLRAVILQEQGATAEAGVALKQALYLDPDFVLAYFALGNLEARRQRLKEAEKQFTTALALLQRYRDDEALPLSDGLAAGRLRAMIQSILSMERRV